MNLFDAFANAVENIYGKEVADQYRDPDRDVAFPDIPWDLDDSEFEPDPYFEDDYSDEGAARNMVFGV